MENIIVPLHLADARKAAGLSTRQLAERLGISNPTIYRWESKTARPEPGASVLMRICEVCQLPPGSAERLARWYRDHR